MMRLLRYFQYISEEETSSAKNVEVAKEPSKTQELPGTAEVKKELGKAKVDPALAGLEARTGVMNSGFEHKKTRAPKDFSEMITSSSLEKDFNAEFFHKVDALVLQYTDSALGKILAPSQRNQIKNAILVTIMELYTNPNREKTQEGDASTGDKKEKKSRTDMILDSFSSKNVGKSATITGSLKSFGSSLKPMLEGIGAVGVVKDVVTITGNITRMFVHAEEAGLILENGALDTKKITNASWNNSSVADGRKFAARALSQPDITTKNIITKETYSTYFNELFTKDVAGINTVVLGDKLSTVINASKNPAELKSNIAKFVDSAGTKLSGIQSAGKTMLQYLGMSDEMAGTVVDELKKIIPPRASTLLGFIFGNGSGDVITNDVENENNEVAEEQQELAHNADDDLGEPLVMSKDVETIQGNSLFGLDSDGANALLANLIGVSPVLEFIQSKGGNLATNIIAVSGPENGFKFNNSYNKDGGQTAKGPFQASAKGGVNGLNKHLESNVNAGVDYLKKQGFDVDPSSLNAATKHVLFFIGHTINIVPDNGKYTTGEYAFMKDVFNDPDKRIQWLIDNKLNKDKEGPMFIAAIQRGVYDFNKTLKVYDNANVDNIAKVNNLKLPQEQKEIESDIV